MICCSTFDRELGVGSGGKGGGAAEEESICSGGNGGGLSSVAIGAFFCAVA